MSKKNKDFYSIDDKNKHLVREIQSQMGFLTLMQYFDNGIYQIPKNQRNYVWKHEQIGNLIESLIMGYPIPPIYCYRNEKQQLIILDGQQRLVSLFLYYKNSFIKNSINKSINLKKIFIENSAIDKPIYEQLDEEYGLKDTEYYFKRLNKITGQEEKKYVTYKNLDSETKRIVDFRVINIIEIMIQGTENKEDILFKIFKNLNQGGVPLKSQELRNGIYQSPFYDMIHQINDENTKWRTIYGSKHKHERDVEFLLRIIAGVETFKIKDGKVELEGFKNTYDKFLNDFSKKSLNFDSEKIKKLKNNIESFLDRLDISEKIDILLIESLYFIVNHIEGNYIINKELINKIKQNQKYREYTNSSTAMGKNLKNRLEVVYLIIKCYLEENHE